ncbi:TIGR01440 family protein [Staphylococcus coagulans]|uniref:TIGR01440 family protein n=1 Tax=Staphylococcus coagulans TaxID=74706 RepID=UPI00067A2FED|nr:TIGR01440 family protein [Staphylococcus coagulans]AKS66594.1 hypothetical protein LH95_03545 [Staphylococcus schleiferi]MBA8775161.1 TIGR01440 family protein [Staphylococcus coagulans]MBT2815116.1 TIGR01440 family protein [Staphylococcus coagulans]MBT2817583.1 TIGR01440 family protein [Staphylococcus coagulans]MBT2838104.1 TIGR01440 family protein [Staphylococcus coagulans]
MKALNQLLEELQTQSFFKKGEVCVIGCSTSEVQGDRIGTTGSLEVAETIFNSLVKVQQETGVAFAFQGCEHINRAITIEKKDFDPYLMTEVSVVPDTHAGGSLSTYAYRHMDEPIVVEYIKADSGIDIGQTLIGMHLKHVAVPVRTSVKQIGEAIVTVAKTRPKKIGGERAKYQL